MKQLDLTLNYKVTHKVGDVLYPIKKTLEYNWGKKFYIGSITRDIAVITVSYGSGFPGSYRYHVKEIDKYFYTK